MDSAVTFGIPGPIMPDGSHSRSGEISSIGGIVAPPKVRLLLEIASKFGVPCAITAALMFGAWRALSWGADNLALPGLRAHVSFLDRTVATQDQIAGTLDKLAESQSQLANGQRETATKLSSLIDEHKLTREMLSRLVRPQKAPPVNSDDNGSR